MENIYEKIDNTLNESVLGCKVSKIKRIKDADICISYMLHPSIPVNYGDNDYENIEHEVQVDVWVDYKISIHSIVEKIIQLMKENGFKLVSIRADMYESDTNIIHKPILFSYLEQIK